MCVLYSLISRLLAFLLYIALLVPLLNYMYDIFTNITYSHVPLDYTFLFILVTSSHYSAGDGELEMEIETRFPMFGGWQTQFYIGYSIPTGKYALE